MTAEVLGQGVLGCQLLTLTLACKDTDETPETGSTAILYHTNQGEGKVGLPDLRGSGYPTTFSYHLNLGMKTLKDKRVYVECKVILHRCTCTHLLNTHSLK